MKPLLLAWLAALAIAAFYPYLYVTRLRDPGMPVALRRKAYVPTDYVPLCPPGQIPWDIPMCIPDPAEGTLYIDDVCWGTGRLQIALDPKGCTFLMDGKKIGSVDPGQIHWSNGKLSPDCEARVSQSCMSWQLVQPAIEQPRQLEMDSIARARREVH